MDRFEISKTQFLPLRNSQCKGGYVIILVLLCSDFSQLEDRSQLRSLLNLTLGNFFEVSVISFLIVEMAKMVIEGLCVSQSCRTLCDPVDCIALQAPLSIGFSRQEQVASSSSRELRVQEHTHMKKTILQDPEKNENKTLKTQFQLEKNSLEKYIK